MMQLKGGWRIKPKLSGDPEYAKYVQRMAEEQRERFPPKPRPVRPEGMSEEDFQFSLQPESTKQIILAQKDPDYKRDWSAPLPDNVIANPDAKNVDELVGVRILSSEEIRLHNSRVVDTSGESTKASVSKETKAKAVDRFMKETPLLTDLEMFHLKRGTIDTEPYSKWENISGWKAFWLMVTGRKNQVRSEKE